jgi:hypothetical protein
MRSAAWKRPRAEVLAARAEHAALKAEHDVAIVAWYEAGCVGDRPEVPLKMLRLENEIGDLVRNLGTVDLASTLNSIGTI